MSDEKTTAPVAPVHPVKREFHGREFVDNYEWLRDKQSQETLDYLNAENDYTAAHTGHLDAMTENIFQEIKSRIKQTDMSVPARRGKYWYYGRSEEGKNYGYSCRIPVEEGSDPWTAPVTATAQQITPPTTSKATKTHIGYRPRRGVCVFSWAARRRT